MDHQQWLDNIPFYLNGTLSEAERQQFEAVLRANPGYAVHIEEWRRLAQAVVEVTFPKGGQLPPIAPHVREQLQHQPRAAPPPPPIREVTPPKRKRPRRRRGQTLGISFGIAAAFATIIGLGMLFGVLGNDDAALPTPDAVAFGPTATDAFGAPAGGDGDDSPLPSPSPLVILPPTTTPLPPREVPPGSGVGGGNEAGSGGAAGPTFTPLPPTATMQPMATASLGLPFDPAAAAQLVPQATVNPSGNCYVVNNGPAQNIYQYADTTSDVIGVMASGARYDTWVHTGQSVAAPYYQVFLPESTIRLGWVDARSLQLFGPDGGTCDRLMEPTPTNPAFPGNLPTAVTEDVCRLASATGEPIPIYSVPDVAGASVLRTAANGTILVPLRIYLDEQWFQVRIEGVGVGWVQLGDVTRTGACDNLPVARDYVEPSPTPTRQN